MRYPAGLALVALLLAGGCGGPEPLALADLPVFPGARELAANAPAAGAVAEALRQDAAARAAAGPGGTIGARRFQLPGTAGWAEVRAFYAGALGAAGWKPGEASGVTAAVTANVLGLGEGDRGRSASWRRGAQTLTVRLEPGAPAELVLQLATR